MSMFLKLGDIRGESLAVGFEGQIEVRTFAYGASQPLAPVRGEGAQMVMARAVHRPLKIQKLSDRSTPGLCQALWEGRLLPEAVLTVCADGPDGLTPYLVITLGQVLLADYQLAGSGSLPLESLSLNYSRIEVSYLPALETGDGPVSAAFDLNAAGEG